MIPQLGATLSPARDIPLVQDSSSEPALDILLTLAEPEAAFQKCAQHTSPDVDQVTYKVLQNLPGVDLYWRILVLRRSSTGMEDCHGRPLLETGQALT